MKKMKLNNDVLLVVGLLICILMGCTIWYAQTLPKVGETDTIFVSDTIRTIDTLTVFKEKPIPKVVIKTKVDTFYTKEGEDTLLITENKVYQDTLTCKDDSVIIASHISGINSNLDSIRVDWRKSETIITNTIEVTKYLEKKKTFFDHFKVGVGVGYGYGFKNKDIEPFAGISINYNF